MPGLLMPRKPEDFGDGGAFPETHVTQYPLGMGKKDGKQKKLGSKILSLTADSHGNVAFDAIVKQNENASKIVYSKHEDIVPKVLVWDRNENEKSDEELKIEIQETTQSTKAALEKILNVGFSVAQPTLIMYKPSHKSAAFNSGAKGRMVRMVDMPVDPLEPSKFKHKKVPKASGSPPVPVIHSPPRPVTVKDQQDWVIPPCVSNWKNPKGYTIPLDKRLAADGRGLEEVQINDNFAKLSEALYVTEDKARVAVDMRAKVDKEMKLKEKERKEHELLELAQKARYELRESAPRESNEEREGCLRRKEIQEERRRERKRERRMEAKDAAVGKRIKSKMTRDRDRDVSEKVSLGMASTTGGAGRGGEVMYDQGLFNQDKGMDSGFATDGQYNVYDKRLFSAVHNTLSTLYKPRKDTDAEMYGGAHDEQLEKVLKTYRFKPDKGFTGAPEKAAGPRDRPVEFDKLAEEADPFGLDQFLTEVNKRK